MKIPLCTLLRKSRASSFSVLLKKAIAPLVDWLLSPKFMELLGFSLIDIALCISFICRYKKLLSSVDLTKDLFLQLHVSYNAKFAEERFVIW